ncbi:MAG: hypothetical protein AAGG81_05015 [Chlamydiota bacterium]
MGFYLQIDIKFHTLNAVVLTFLGPFSLVIALLTLTFFYLFIKFLPPLKQLLKELNPDVSRSLGELCYQEVMTAGATRPGKERVVPLNYYDIVELGTTKQKQQAIAKILRHFHPGFAPILFALINDEVSCIRVLAATAINTIDQKYTELALTQEKIIEKFPENFQELKKLAMILETYLSLNILDEDRKLKIEDQVASLFEKLHKELSNDPEVLYYYAKSLESRGNVIKSYNVLYQLIEKGLEMTPPMKLLLTRVGFKHLPHDKWLDLLETINKDTGSKEKYLLTVEEIELEDISHLWGVNGRLSEA